MFTMVIRSDTRAQQLLRWATVWPQQVWAKSCEGLMWVAKCPVGPHLIERGLESGILVRPTIWSQEICAENWVGPCPFGRRGTGSQCKYNAVRAEADLLVKFHSNPSSRLASVLKTARQNRTDRQTDR